MSGELKVGAIFHHRDFEFEDGTKRNKYLVVLGAKPDHDYLCALTTSQQRKKKTEWGCHPNPYCYFYIPGDGKNFFPKNTWIILSEPVIMSRVEAIEKGMQNIVHIEANLKDNIAGEIRNCLKSSRDISKRQSQLL